MGYSRITPAIAYNIIQRYGYQVTEDKVWPQNH
jgi:hypothetical protein